MKKFLPEDLRSIEPRFHKLEEAQLKTAESSTLGWHSICLDLQNQPLGGGFHASRKIARSKAIAETAERAVYRKLRNSKDAADFLLNKFPSSCGFAAGFKKETTEDRAICEAIERWAWSQWIDKRLSISEVPVNNLTHVSKELLRSFSRVRYFSKDIVANVLGEISFWNLQILLGFTEKGIFPGSRVSPSGYFGWEHAAIEAWRHLQIFEKRQKNSKIYQDLVYGRIMFFGNNYREAERQIPPTNLSSWPVAQVDFMKTIDIGNIFVTRALCSNYIGWHEGDIKRFVY